MSPDARALAERELERAVGSGASPDDVIVVLADIGTSNGANFFLAVLTGEGVSAEIAQRQLDAQRAAASTRGNSVAARSLPVDSVVDFFLSLGQSGEWAAAVRKPPPSGEFRLALINDEILFTTIRRSS
jgi:hypothetical protein